MTRYEHAFVDPGSAVDASLLNASKPYFENAELVCSSCKKTFDVWPNVLKRGVDVVHAGAK